MEKLMYNENLDTLIQSLGKTFMSLKPGSNHTIVSVGNDGHETSVAISEVVLDQTSPDSRYFAWDGCSNLEDDGTYFVALPVGDGEHNALVSLRKCANGYWEQGSIQRRG